MANNHTGESNDSHIAYLRLALSTAEKCVPTSTAFCVGCVLVIRIPVEGVIPFILSTGYSRELPGNTHAEANALSKAMGLSKQELCALLPPGANYFTVEELLKYADVYTTLEPCSIRTSGLSPCADALILAKVNRCFIGVGEPDDFVKCEGAQKLHDAGIEVLWLKDLQEQCLAIARRGHNTNTK